MSFATSIGHSFTGVVGHPARVHPPRRHRAVMRAATPSAPATPPEPHRVRSTVDIDAGVADRRRELAQWSTAFTLAVGFNR